MSAHKPSHLPHPCLIANPLQLDIELIPAGVIVAHRDSHGQHDERVIDRFQQKLRMNEIDFFCEMTEKGWDEAGGRG